jgi:ATP-dependent Clp protease ATP-binding subunit ClpC
MDSENSKPEDWFTWAESFKAEWKTRDDEWNQSWSPPARKVLEFATTAALSLRNNAVGAEHLLAGILRLNSGTAAAALRRAGLTLPLLRTEIEAAWGASDRKKEPERPIPYTPRCWGIVQRARSRARARGDAPVEAEDLFLELLTEKEGLPAKIFRKRSVDIEALRNAATTEGGRP